MMNRIINAHRTAALPLRRHHLLARPISSTPSLSHALPAPATSSEEPKTAQKKVKKEKRGPSQTKLKAQESQANKQYEMMIRAFDTPHRKPPPASEEEMARRYQVGRNYVIGCFERHNEQNHDLAVKIRMKQHALRMLPKKGEVGDRELEDGKSLYGGWREMAFEMIEDVGPPDHRHVPQWTPPIEGFDPNIYIDQEEEDT